MLAKTIVFITLFVHINSKVIKIKGLLLTSDGKPMSVQFKDEIQAETIETKEEANKSETVKPMKVPLPSELMKTIKDMLRKKDVKNQRKINEVLPPMYVPVSEDNPNPQFIPQDYAKKKMFRDGLKLIDSKGSLVYYEI